MARLLVFVVDGGSVSDRMRQTIQILNTFEEAEKTRQQYLNAWMAELTIDSNLEDSAGFMEWGRLLGYKVKREKVNSSEPVLRPGGSPRSRSPTPSRSPRTGSSGVHSVSSSRPVPSSRSATNTKASQPSSSLPSSARPFPSRKNFKYPLYIAHPELERRAATRQRYGLFPDATEQYLLSIVRLSRLQERLLCADSTERLNIFQELVNTLHLSDSEGEYQVLAHIFTTFYGTDLPQEFIGVLRDAMDTMPELQYSPLFQRVLEIFGQTSNLESYVKAFEQAMDSASDLPAAARVSRQRKKQEKKKRREKKKRSQPVPVPPVQAPDCTQGEDHGQKMDSKGFSTKLRIKVVQVNSRDSL